MSEWAPFGWGLFSILASALVADWRCRRWRKLAEQNEKIARDAITNLAAWDEACAGWKATSVSWREIAKHASEQLEAERRSR